MTTGEDSRAGMVGTIVRSTHRSLRNDRCAVWTDPRRCDVNFGDRAFVPPGLPGQLFVVHQHTAASARLENIALRKKCVKVPPLSGDDHAWLVRHFLRDVTMRSSG